MAGKNPEAFSKRRVFPNDSPQIRELGVLVTTSLPFRASVSTVRRVFSLFIVLPSRALTAAVWWPFVGSAMASMFASASPTPEPPRRTQTRKRKSSETSDSDNPITTNLSAWQAVNVPKKTINNGRRTETLRVVAARSEDEESDVQEVVHARPTVALKRSRVHVDITVPADFDRDEYEDLTSQADIVSQVISERGGHFKVSFEDGRQDTVSVFPVSLSLSYSIRMLPRKGFSLRFFESASFLTVIYWQDSPACLYNFFSTYLPFRTSILPTPSPYHLLHLLS